MAIEPGLNAVAHRLDFNRHADLDNLLGGNMEDGTCAGVGLESVEQRGKSF